VRPLVGRHWFRPNERDSTVESTISKSGRDGVPGGATADDDYLARKRD
jgi:hypothetical protein